MTSDIFQQYVSGTTNEGEKLENFTPGR
jgi:hypothetical protein